MGRFVLLKFPALIILLHWIFFATVSADRCLVIFLLFFIAFLFLSFVRKYDGVCRSGGIGFDELHYLLHCICHALDECLHLTCMVLRQCCDELLRCLGLFFDEIGFELLRGEFVLLIFASIFRCNESFDVDPRFSFRLYLIRYVITAKQ